MMPTLAPDTSEAAHQFDREWDQRSPSARLLYVRQFATAGNKDEARALWLALDDAIARLQLIERAVQP